MRATVLTVLVLAICMSATIASAQCLLRPVELSQRIDESSTIVEGRVTGKSSYWNAARNLIYTTYTIDVYKVFKGSAAQSIVEIIAEGGIVGNDMHQLEPNLTMQAGDVGIFMLEPTVYEKNPASTIPASATYRAYALSQGFVKYNEQEKTAYDVFNRYDNIPVLLYNRIVQRTGQSFHIIKPYSISESSQRGNRPEAAPVISNFSPTTISAGTKSVLTINGSNFGASMGTSTVLFKDANDGGATYYTTPSTEIITWTDNQITVYVPTRAGTGTIQVNVPGEGTGTSAQTLTVTFSNLNVSSAGQHVTRFVSDNGNGGYTLSYFTGFASNTSAREAFERAFVNWRCGTFVNWQIGASTAVNVHAQDDINIVRFDVGTELPAGVLGQCASYWSSCNGINWHLYEMDIRFDDGTNWYYGTGSPGGSQFDFESVSLHELGHGHQLGHEINPGAVMHFSIANGAQSRVLSANDLDGGNTVMTRSTSNPFCGQPLMIALTAGTCQLHTAGDYRSKQTGLWDAPSSWERFDGSNWVNAVDYPNYSDGKITIRSGHNITATAGQFSADELTVDAGGTLTLENLSFLALTDGPGDDLVVHGTMVWNNMLLMGPGNAVIGSTGTLNINSTSYSTLTADLTNNGTINWNSFDLNNSGSSNITNNGIFNINSNHDLMGMPITNNGTVNKNSSGLTRMFNFTCHNSGAWNLNAGTFEAPEFVNTGMLSFSNGAVFRNGGGFHHNSGASIQGTGSFQNSQNLYVNVNMVFPSTIHFTLSPGQNISGDGNLTLNQNFIFEGNNISGNGTFTVNGNIDWREGTLTRLTTIGSPDTLFFTTPAFKVLSKNLINNGTIAWNDGDLFIFDTLVNNAIFNINGNNATTVTSVAAIRNSGTITKYSSGTTSIHIQIINNPTGIIKGIGTYDLTMGFLNNNSGTIEPGLSPGIVTINGTNSDILYANSTLLIEIAGAGGAGNPTGHDQLQRAASMNLNGKLKVLETGAVPEGDYTVLDLTSGTINGTFSTLDLPPNYLVFYHPDSVVVRKICIPAVSIAASPGNSICAGTNVTFTATPTFGGVPSYQWKLNGNNVGTNSPTYSNAALVNGDVITCVMTSSLSCATPTTATSNAITMTVIPIVVPSVSIAANPGNTICEGTNVTFTATPTNGGTTPAYQWKLNGNNVGTNSNTYSNAALANGDVVTCVLTSNALCATPTTATSNAITMTVNPILAPSVSISANPGHTICAGANVIFTATPTNGGATPAYQWKLNGNNVGTNSNSYSNAALANGDIVTCVLTSSVPCPVPPTATSNAITMTVTPNVTPSVSIAASPGNNICAGTNVTFTATPTNGGATPAYQWKLNGNNVGTNSNTYSNAALANGDVVTCVLTSSLLCVTSSTATSNAITMNVTANVTPAVSISASPGTTVCAGTNVTFTATPTNGGATPSYQWKLNGNNVGTNSPTYSNAALVNGDVVSCVMTTSLVCVTATTATSNNITITITSSVTPSVSIAASPGTTVCAGTNVTFTATPTNGGVTPSYQWKLNGNNVGTNSNTYSNASLVNGDVVSCVLTSSEPCAVPTTAASNNITMTITPNVTPSVSIAASPGSSVCAGTNVTFSATPTNGGATPSYQWKLNGNNVGTNSNTYSNAALVNGDVVTCVLTSSLLCVTSSTATSNAITMNVTANVTPAVSIAASPGTTVCAGTNVTFTATPTNGGATPSYQWKLNGNNVGTNSPTYSNAALVNGDVVSCVMTSSVTCVTTPTATSNNITITIISSVTPSVSISASPGNTICAGTNVTFTATPTNGGTTPSYQWRVNGNNVGTNSPTYQNAALANGDVVTCILTSSESCAVPPTATSNAITMNVTANVTPAVSIVASPGNNICAGTNVTFTATATNGGATPSYQWRLNGNNVGTNSPTYSNASLVNGDVITCILNSSVTCVTSPTATSNAITMNVTANVTPAVSIAANPGNNICAGTNVTFTATPTNGGATPSYQWRLNGNNVGTNSPTYSNASLANGDVVTCVLTSSLTCVTSSTATSNAITMNVTANVTPAVSIAASPGSTVCIGTNVTFTATPVNGGTSPSYQWRLNGNNVGTNSPTYQNAALVTGDVITCIMTSSLTCITSSTATSNAITMTVNVPPAITAHPQNQTVFVGTNVTFTVTATGSGLTYQWRKNGVNIPGATASSYTINNVATGDAGNYDVVVSGACPPSVTSNVAVLTVNAVTITTHPSSQAVCEGLNVTFTVVAAGPSLTYQWQVSTGGGPFSNIAGATNASLTLNAVTLSMSGNQYRCVVSNLLNSNAATLTVHALPVVTLNLPFDTLYKNSPTQHLGGGVPVGGTYTGPGIIGSFHPSAMTLGNYTITYTFTNANGCTSSATDVFTIIPKADKINIYPVPARDGKVTIIVAEELLNGQAVAWNAIGQKMAQWMVKGRQMSFEFPWGAGAYVIEVRKNGIREVRKFTIVR